MKLLWRLRSALYVAVMFAAVVPWSFVVLGAALVARPKTRYKLCQMWTWLAVQLARLLCGIDWRVEGWERLPDGPGIVMSKHQSTWETLWLATYMPRRLSFTYKRELAYLPFFGWALHSLGMISIDRSRGKDAFQQLVEKAPGHLADGWWITMFPEGTRTAPGETRRYKSGGARLAVATGAPVIPIALNSGECWPRKSLLMRPGVITVVIGDPISSEGKSAEQMAREVEAWIEAQMRRIAPHRYSGPYAGPAGPRPEPTRAGRA